MKNWVLMAAVVLFFAGCAKYTTPRKVSRQITDKTWRITTFKLPGYLVLTGYTKFGFDFYPDDKDVVADQHKIVVSGASEDVTGRRQSRRRPQSCNTLYGITSCRWFRASCR